MRLAAAAATRRERMDQLRHDRAAAGVLRTVLPTLQQLRIELQFSGPDASPPTPQLHVLYPPARAFFEYPCPYADCSGLFDLADAVRMAMSNTLHRAHGVLVCAGSRGGDHASGRPCLLRVAYEVSALL